MEETRWIGRGKASNAENWSNGIPSDVKCAVIPKNSQECIWDIDDISITINIEGYEASITIAPNCYFGGECYAPEQVVVHAGHTDRPPPNYEAKGDGYIWVGDTRYKYKDFMEKWSELFPFGLLAAAVNTWDNSDADNVYSNGNNWSLGTKPATGEDVVIPDTTVIGKCTMDESSAADLGSFEVQANGEFECATFTLDVDGNVTLTGTFTKGTGTLQIGGGAVATITSGGNALYHVILVDTSTIYYMKDDTEIYDIKREVGTTFEIDSVSEGAALTLSFTDASGCGIVSSLLDYGKFLFQGSATYHVTVTTTVEPPTNRWISSPGQVGNGNEWDYADVKYYTGWGHATRQNSAEYRNCTFNNGSGGMAYALGRQRDTPGGNRVFENLTFTGTCTSVHYSSSATYTNLNVSAMTYTNMFRVGGITECVNCNFDWSKLTYWASEGPVISKHHNDVSGDYRIKMQFSTTTVNKSAITNDFTSSDIVTIYVGKLICDEAAASISVNIESDGEYKIDAVTAATSLTHSFTDSSNSGFGISSGTLTCIGNATYGVTINSSGSPPTNFWDFLCPLSITADYTTFDYFYWFQCSGVIDIDNCTFQNAKSSVGTNINGTVSSFDNNTFVGNSDQTTAVFRTEKNLTMTNLVISGTYSGYSIDIASNNKQLELINCNFDETKLYCGLNTVLVISKDHKDVSNDYRIWIGSVAWNKSSITNDFGSADNVTLTRIPGGSGTAKLIADEAIAHTDFTIKTNTELEVNGGITHTITNTTGNITVESGGTLDWTGSEGSIITLVSDSPGTQWFLDAQSGSTVTVSYVNVTDSNANAGEEIDASDGTNVGDGQNNDNWLFATPKALILGKVIILKGVPPS